MPTLLGRKVILRTVIKKDISIIFQWLNDPEIIHNLQIFLPLGEFDEDRWLSKVGLSENDIIFTIKAKVDSDGIKPIGVCVLHSINWKDRHATFGIFIGEKDFWRRGCGTEAARLLMGYGFQDLNLHRIESMVYSFNEISLAMHKKLGFQVEGCKRQAVFKDGKYEDEVILGLLRNG